MSWSIFGLYSILSLLSIITIIPARIPRNIMHSRRFYRDPKIIHLNHITHTTPSMALNNSDDDNCTGFSVSKPPKKPDPPAHGWWMVIHKEQHLCNGCANFIPSDYENAPGLAQFRQFPVANETFYDLAYVARNDDSKCGKNGTYYHQSVGNFSSNQLHMVIDSLL